jgi:hypothetical protein
LVIGGNAEKVEMKIHLKPNQHQQNRINLWEFLMFKM